MNKEENFLDFQYAVAQDAAPEKVQVNIDIFTNLSEQPDARAIDMIQAYTCAIEMVAKDLHYRAKGKSFYGEHLLADLVTKICDHKDEINEVFYLGDKAMPPPLMCYTAANACKIVEQQGLSTDKSETELVDGLYLMCKMLADTIETAKKANEYKAGVQALLDNVSGDALQLGGLLHRASTEVDIQASGVAEQEKAEAAAVAASAEEVASAPVVIETIEKTEE